MKYSNCTQQYDSCLFYYLNYFTFIMKNALRWHFVVNWFYVNKTEMNFITRTQAPPDRMFLLFSFFFFFNALEHFFFLLSVCNVPPLPPPLPPPQKKNPIRSPVCSGTRPGCCCRKLCLYGLQASCLWGKASWETLPQVSRPELSATEEEEKVCLTTLNKLSGISPAVSLTSDDF